MICILMFCCILIFSMGLRRRASVASLRGCRSAASTFHWARPYSSLPSTLHNTCCAIWTGRPWTRRCPQSNPWVLSWARTQGRYRAGHFRRQPPVTRRGAFRDDGNGMPRLCISSYFPWPASSMRRRAASLVMPDLGGIRAPRTLDSDGRGICLGSRA